MKKRRYIIFAFCIFIFAFTLVSCQPNTKKDLEMVKVTRGNILAQLPTNGTVIPRNRLEIKPPVSGRIEQVLVGEGQNVTKGVVIAWMSSSERAALLDAARAKGSEEVSHWQDVYKPAPIVAPLDGFIIKRNMEPGQFFTLNDTVVVMADRLIVQSQVDETDIGKIKAGQKAEIKLDAYPNDSISGYVEQIAYESQTVNNVTIYNVNVIPSNVPWFFKSGMSATINFRLQEKDNILCLPFSAVKKKSGNSYVFVKEAEKILAKQIQTGLENDEVIEVISGLAEGNKVIVPNAKLVQELLQKDSHRNPMDFLGKRKK